jgi:enamine deaminase RidA (YjgF/YER057c/UK114 family)
MNNTEAAAMSDPVHARLAALDLHLPPPHPPVANYVGAVISGNQLWIAGVGPTVGSEVRFANRIGDEIGLEDAKLSVELTVLNILANANVALSGELSRIQRSIKCLLLLRATAAFRDGFLLAEHASNMFVNILGASAAPAVSVTTAPALPIGISSEMDAVFEIR